MRSGFFELPSTAGTLRYAGHAADYWSSRAAYTSSTSATAYYLEFATAVNPSSGPSSRWLGFPLRCLSTVLDMQGCYYLAMQRIAIPMFLFLDADTATFLLDM